MKRVIRAGAGLVKPAAVDRVIKPRRHFGHRNPDEIDGQQISGWQAKLVVDQRSKHDEVNIQRSR